MSYQVLARKYRPRGFATLVGQEHVVKALRHALDQQRLHHAYLFTGTRGVGKTTIARILAKCLNCESGITSEPCGKCGACTEIDGGRFVDLLEVDAATNTKVDEMRQLLETAQYAPTRGRFKVYVIDEVHMLSTSAFNAMLKTLEEPPEHLKFILATTDPQKIPVTVLSRCLQFSLKQMPRSAIVEHLVSLLKMEQIAFEPEALPQIARAAAGSMRDALSLLDQAISHGAGQISAESVREMLGAVDETYLFRILDAIAEADGQSLVSISNEMQARSLSFDSALADLAALLLRIALARKVPEALDPGLPERERVMLLSERLSDEEIQLYYQIALQGREDLPLAPDDHSGFLMTLLRMLAFSPEPSEGGRVTPSEASPIAAAKPAVRMTGSAKAAGIANATFDGDWPALVRELAVGGAAKQLAHNSTLAAHGTGSFDLVVPKSMAFLCERSYSDKLKAVLEQKFSSAVSLRVSVGDSVGHSVFAMEQSDRDARLAAATESVQEDRFVKELVDIFDARVVNNSIRPQN